ncbi:hypothetical protein Tco_0178936 [Tanacetum coccineum]
MDMFRDILYVPVETPKNPFIAPVNIEIIEAFMNRLGYQGVVDKGKGYRGIGLWGKVRGELGEVLERWFGAETVGRGGLGFGGYGGGSTRWLQV